MSRGPGHVARAIEQALQDTDRSFTVEELATFAYPDIAAIEKKHRVVILRTFKNLQEKLSLWFFRTYKPPWRLIVTNRNNVRSYAHGLLRHWNAERSLEQTEKILSDPEIKTVMEPGGLWWTEVEINKAEDEHNVFIKSMETNGLVKRDGGLRSWKVSDAPPEMEDLRKQLFVLRSYRAWLTRDASAHKFTYGIY